MKVIVAGGDGFCGWPTALHLSARGHEVIVADNLSRRGIDQELGTNSLTPITTLETRAALWSELTGHHLSVAIGDLTDAQFVHELFARFEPDGVVHFAEQRSAPYSMIDRQHAVSTQVNNVVGTLNLLFAIHAFGGECHLVKLGTMGEYGTPNIDIEEGYLEIEHNGRRDTLPYPKQPGSFYHLSKVHDSHNIMFACNTWGLRATDLNQGIVYNVQTEQTSANRLLVNRYDYDGVFGTALNRFCAQVACEAPITVHGRGGQTRGFIDLRDTVRCIELALESPPPAGELRVMNQFTEQWSVLQLAERVSRVAIALGRDAPIEHLANPRVESESHYYRARSSKLLDLGLEPHLLDDTTVAGLIEDAIRHRDRIRPDTIAAHADWRAVPYWEAQHGDADHNGDKDGNGGERLSRGSPSRHA
jgi:UDP-sulfoquinovose synthase